MTRPFPTELARTLPKAELHVHLEGTVDAVTLLDLAARHGVDPPAADIEGIEAWYKFDDFPMFLERYFAVLALLREPEDFALVAERYMQTAHQQGVVHIEFHVSATGHIVENAKAWAPIHDGIVAGCTQAAGATGMTWGLIPDVSPHLKAADCADAMSQVFAHNLDHIVAIGMGGPADNWFTDDFASIYTTARSLGIPGVSHAAEHGGPAEVRFAIEQFEVERIQHGIGVVSDPEAVAMLVDRSIPCDVCPGSNLALHAVESADAHPLPHMLDAGITVTIGTDDPPMFQTNLLDDYRRAWDWCGLDEPGLRQLMRNSIDASYAAAVGKRRWLDALAEGSD